MPDGAEKRESRSLKHWKKMQAESQEFRNKQSKRVSDYQKKQRMEMNEEELDAKKKSHAQYMVEWRQKRKMKNLKVKITTLSPRSTMKRKTGFRAKPALYKAVRRLMSHTPTSPSKKKGAVCELAKQCGLVVVTPKSSGATEPSSSTSTPRSKNAITQEVKDLVKDFFFQSNIVYTAPGLKDEMVHWEAGKKVKLRKYYLELTLKEALGVFKEQHPSVNKIGSTRFRELKLRFFFLGRHRPTQGSWYLTKFLQLQTHFLVGRKILSRKLLNYVFIDLDMYYVYAQNMYLCR